MTSPWRRAVLAALAVLLLAPAVARASPPTYANPVLGTDEPDPTVLKVGHSFYASSTAASWAPLFGLFRSTDLVRWRRVGAILAKPPAWAGGNFFAPELVHWGRRFYAFYSANRAHGPPCLAVATAATVRGPYADRGPVLCTPHGAIDAYPFVDADGSHWLVFKDQAPGERIAIQRFSPARLRAVGPRRTLVRPDSDWEHGTTEGPALIRRGGRYLLLYAGGSCCARPCTYAEGAASAPRLLGPYAKDPANPFLASNAAFFCPGHGTTLDLGARGTYLVHHAFVAGDALQERRPDLLDRLDFDPAGWPVVAGGSGPVASAPAPLGHAAPPPAAGFSDGFAGHALRPSWEWPWYRLPAVHVGAGAARLSCDSGNRAIPFVARQVPVDAFSAAATVLPSSSGGPAVGLAVHGPGRLLRGIELRDGVVRPFRITGDRLQLGTAAPAPYGRRVQLLASVDATGHLVLASRSGGGPASALGAGPAAAGPGPPTRVALTCRGHGSVGVSAVRVTPAT